MTRIINPDDPGHINDVVDQIIDEHAKKVALQSLRTVSRDEQVFTQALEFYDVVKKDHQGYMHRQHVNTLTWFLSHVTDDGLLDCAAQITGEPMTTAKQCFARIAQVILRKRGVGRASIIVN